MQNPLTTTVLPHRHKKKTFINNNIQGEISHFVPLTVYLWVLPCTSFAVVHNRVQHLCFNAFFSSGRTCNCTCFYPCEEFNEFPIKFAIKSKYASRKDKNVCVSLSNFKCPEDLSEFSLCPVFCLSDLA